jgi:hypothetical protein
MGQTRLENLEKLLLLGEPEAVTAVVNAEGLPLDMAQRAWWCLQNPEIARHLLGKESLTGTRLAQELVDYLWEHLPFEEEPLTIAKTVALILDTKMAPSENILHLWERGQRKHPILAGFLLADPNNHPQPSPANDAIRQEMESASDLNGLLTYLSSTAGQTFLQTAIKTLDRVMDQDLTTEIFKQCQRRFSLADKGPSLSTIEEAQDHCANRFSDKIPYACLLLSTINDSMLNPVFSRTDASGSVMRKKIKPLLDPIKAAMRSLLPQG